MADYVHNVIGYWPEILPTPALLRLWGCLWLQLQAKLGSCCTEACWLLGSPGSFGKILLYTLLGISLNGVLWLLGPQNPDCDPGTGYGRQECQGAIFDFTISPFSGKVFPIVFQHLGDLRPSNPRPRMWYTGMLLALMLFNWPLFGYLKNGSCSFALLALQLIVTAPQLFVHEPDSEVAVESVFVILSAGPWAHCSPMQ